MNKSVDMPKEQAYRWETPHPFRGVGGAYAIPGSPWQR